MTNPVFPSGMPQKPKRNGFTGGPVDTRPAFKPERGPAITRAGGTALFYRYSVTFGNLTPAQVAIWEGFVADDLAGGAKAFEWDHPITEVTHLWKIDPQGDLLYQLSAQGARLSELSVNLLRLPDVVA